MTEKKTEQEPTDGYETAEQVVAALEELVRLEAALEALKAIHKIT